MDIDFDLGGDSFVWDSAKAGKNLAKHGVSFEEAATVSKTVVTRYNLA